MRVAKILIVDDTRSALLLRRSGTHPSHAYEPDLPGGIIEHGESYEEGLVREVREEAGISINAEDLRLLTTKEGYGLAKKRLYLARLTSRPEVTISWEHDRATWVPLNGLTEALGSNDSYMRFVADYLSKNTL